MAKRRKKKQDDSNVQVIQLPHIAWDNHELSWVFLYSVVLYKRAVRPTPPFLIFIMLIRKSIFILGGLEFDDLVMSMMPSSGDTPIWDTTVTVGVMKRAGELGLGHG